MHETVTEYRFVEVMHRHGFSYEGAHTLFRVLEDYEELTGTQMEFDPVAIRCDFKEYASAGEAATDFYGHDIADKMTEAEAYDRLEEDFCRLYPIHYNGHFWGYIAEPR